MILPGGGPLPNITGGPATSTSGDVRSEQQVRGAGGITAPVIIGGFKSDGTASGGALPAWVLWTVGLSIAAGFAYWVWRNR